MTGACPSDLRLEAHLLEPLGSAVAPHVDGCSSCQARLHRMEADGEDFRRYVYPATVDAVLDAARPSRRRNWFAALLSVTAATGTGILLLLRPVPPESYLGLKGDPLVLSVFVGTPEGARVVADGAQIPAASAIRFQVRTPAPCRLWIVSVDGAGQVSRLFPPWGDEGAEVTAPGPLPGGAVLDGRPGPERVFAVCATRPLGMKSLEAAGRLAASGGPGGVRLTRRLEGLPQGVLQASLLIEKGD
jgi:hypothetical protein